jgi:hypothetical protein
MDNKDKPANPCLHQPNELGLTKLEAFTMAAMQGLISNPGLESFEPHAFAHDAVVLAKATLAALEKANE